MKIKTDGGSVFFTAKLRQKLDKKSSEIQCGMRWISVHITHEKL